MKDLADKVAVVTGAASGIGLALATRFAAERMKVVLADVEAAPLARVTDDLCAAGATVLAVPPTSATPPRSTRWPGAPSRPSAPSTSSATTRASRAPGAPRGR
jgi:hypothetical protein